MTLLIIDNYDSFTHNLYQYLGELGASPTVRRNDEIDLPGIRRLAPTHIVLSPGPGRPENPRDFGVSGDVIAAISATTPTLGVCLGHQGIIHRLGGRVVSAPEIVHGRTSRVRHSGDGLFAGLPPEIEVMRYHSLLGDRASLPPSLRITAETIEDALIMAVEHEAWPLYGIQFHPESIGTPMGKRILENFLRGAPRSPARTSTPSPPSAAETPEGATRAVPRPLAGERPLWPPPDPAGPYRGWVRKLERGVHLDAPEARAAMAALMDGALSTAQIATFLALLAQKGETAEELAGLASVMRARATRVLAPGELMDTCGTGGSGLRTPNTSTMVAFVLAALGVRIAKHGNRASTGLCGSMDVLEALDVPIDLGPAEVLELIEQAGIAFMLAPRFHPAMKHVAPVRREIGIRTTFNFLGPLANPAGATLQVLGVSDPRRAPIMAEALSMLGTRRALLVSGADGLDEITLAGATRGWLLAGGHIEEITIRPEALGLAIVPPRSLEGGDRKENARTFIEVLSGRERGPIADLVALNAAAGLLVAERASDLAAGLEMARDKLGTGAAYRLFERYRELARRAGGAR